MKISIIVAAANNNAIGRDGQLPWHLSEDLKRFKRLTIGKPVIMGRRTQQSIGKALPGRRNIVLSRRKGLKIEGCEVAHAADAALSLAAGSAEVMVIGGAKVYDTFLPMAGRIYLTRVDSSIEGDSFFPSIDDSDWRVLERQDYAASESRQYGFSFITLDRV